MRRPIIGIEADVDATPKGTRFAKVYEAYYAAVFAAGGFPVLLPPLDGPEPIDAALEYVDGIVVPGGDDLPAQDYGEEPLVCERTSHVNAQRYRYGRDLVRAAARADRPLLGVCYGHQLLNVALGGSLVQDIPIQLGIDGVHRIPDGDSVHELDIEPGSRLARIAGASRVKVNSKHHQSVKRPGEGLTVVAKSPDGVIEAVESERHRFLLGVQWHPERMGPGVLGWGIFEPLVEAARSRH